MKMPLKHFKENPSVANRAGALRLLLMSTLLTLMTMGPRVAVAAANGIDILSRNHQLSGEWESYDYYGDLLDSGSYSLASNTHGIAYTRNDPGVIAYVNTFSLHDEAWVGFEDEYTRASGDWQFRPEQSILDLGLSVKYLYNYYSWEQGLYVSLTDLTSGTSLLSLDPGYWGSYYWESDQYQFNVDPTHTYDFSIFGWTSNYGFKDVTEDVHATFLSKSTIPDPGPSGRLLAMAMAGILLLRWKLSYK